MKTKTKRAQSIVGTNSDGSRPKGDFYPTPDSVVEALLRVETFGRHIWEPACGSGNISRVLINAGYTVVSSDLYNHGFGHANVDFLTMRPFYGQTPIDAIVTNPPFSLAEEFVQRAYDLGVRKFAFLARLAFLEGMKRSQLLEVTKLSRVWVFRNRILLTRRGEKARSSGMIAFAWFVWDKTHRGKPTIGWIEDRK